MARQQCAVQNQTHTCLCRFTGGGRQSVSQHIAHVLSTDRTSNALPHSSAHTHTHARPADGRMQLGRKLIISAGGTQYLAAAAVVTSSRMPTYRPSNVSLHDSPVQLFARNSRLPSVFIRLSLNLATAVDYHRVILFFGFSGKFLRFEMTAYDDGTL